MYSRYEQVRTLLPAYVVQRRGGVPFGSGVELLAFLQSRGFAAFCTELDGTCGFVLCHWTLVFSAMPTPLQIAFVNSPSRIPFLVCSE